MRTRPYFFRLLLCFICIAYVGSFGVSIAQKRALVTKIYTSQIGVRELTGHNDGKQVETFLRYCGLGKGNPYCASFVCWTFGQAGIINPRSGYCPDLFRPKVVIWTRASPGTIIPQPGDAFGLFFPEKGRIAHAGFIHAWGKKYAITVEANTNVAGSREGDGVYMKQRPISSIYVVARYINQ